MGNPAESRGIAASASEAPRGVEATGSAGLGPVVPEKVLKALLEASPGAALVLDRSYRIVLATTLSPTAARGSRRA